MIQHVWSVVCQSASFDAQTNSVSLLNTLESLFVLGEPSVQKPAILSCEIVSLWARENEAMPCSGQVRVLLNNPSGAASEIIGLEIDLTKTFFHRTRITIGALPLTASGKFEFQVEYQIGGKKDWKPAAKLPFLVTSQKIETIAPAN